VDWVEGYLAGHGVVSRRVWSACRTKAALYAEAGPRRAGGVVLSGHSDVVPVDGQDWTTDPWVLTERDGRLFGRGTSDMKGFDALAIWALAEAAGAGLCRPLQLALSYDEEVGCTGAPPMIDALRGDLPGAAAVIVGEPTMMRVVTGHKGGFGWRVHVRGHEVHSSRLPQGVSAIMEAARLIDWANARNAENRARPPAALAAAFDPPWTTLHVGMISGGTAHNITARDCIFPLEIRVVPGEDAAAWAARLDAEAARIAEGMREVAPECGITLTPIFEVPALVPEAQGAAEALARRLTGDNGIHVVSYGTEGGQFQQRGYSCVVCGPGDIAQAHQPDEFISLAQMAEGEAFMRRLIAELRR
jgi:acetylornithine deacetylase